MHTLNRLKLTLFSQRIWDNQAFQFHQFMTHDLWLRHTLNLLHTWTQALGLRHNRTQALGLRHTRTQTHART